MNIQEDMEAKLEQALLQLKEATKQAEEQRRLKEEAEQRAEEERRLKEEERLAKVAATKQAEEERRLKEEERRLKEEERRLKEEERRLKEEALAREESAKYMDAIELLDSPLPNYKEVDAPSRKTTTKLSATWHMPAAVEEWNEFDTKMSEVRRAVEGVRVPRREDITNVEDVRPDHVVNIHGIVEPLILKTKNLLAESIEGLADIKRLGIQWPQAMKAGGVCDIPCVLDNKGRAIGELKGINNHFAPPYHANNAPPRHPVEIYYAQPWIGDDRNVAHSLVQVFSYLLAKCTLKLGFATNYDHWFFMRRRHNEDEEEILQVTRIYPKEVDARLAFVTFLVYVMETEPIDLPVGKLDARIVRMGDANRGQREDLEGQPSLPDSGGGGGGSGSAGITRVRRAPDEMEPCDFFNPGTIVAGIEFTTTNDALGIESLTLRATKQSQMIAASDKSTTFRVTLNDRDLVWRQQDIYGVPRHIPELTLRELQLMVIREITVYAHLRSLWGILLPRLYYFGQDFNMFWTLVTSYEGKSLDIVAQEGGNGLKLAVKQRIRSSLKHLHDNGVIHGDVALRNALLRESDGAILWVDFEFASLRSGGVEENREFARSSQWEETLLETELDRVATLPETPIPPAPAPPASMSRHENDPKAPPLTRRMVNKRTKVFASCCCSSPDSESPS